MNIYQEFGYVLLFIGWLTGALTGYGLVLVVVQNEDAAKAAAIVCGAVAFAFGLALVVGAI